MSTELQTALAEIKTGVDAIKGNYMQLRNELDGYIAKGADFPTSHTKAATGAKAIISEIQKHADAFKHSRRLSLEIPGLLDGTKATITSSGLITPDREAGVQGAGRYEYKLRDLFRTVSIATGAAAVLRSQTESLSPVPQASEGSLKAESTFTFGLETVPVETMAHWVNVSKQAFDDVDGLGAFLDEALVWGLARLIEANIIAGSGVSGNLDGLITTATAFDTTILSAGEGYNRMDKIAAAHTQLRESGFTPSFSVVHPRDWFRMVTSKDSQDRYLMGDPQSASEEQVWSKPVVVTNQITSGTFLVGDASKAVIRERHATTVEISDSHDTHFTKNLLCIRAEQRLALVKLREDAFVTGTLTTSPA